MGRGVEGVENCHRKVRVYICLVRIELLLHYSTMSSDSHPTKKIKTAPAGPPIFSDLDLDRMTIDGTPQGAEIKHATVTYGGERLTFQLTDAANSLRAPFGLDDGSKFGAAT